jgi:hypothetical protein
MYLKTKLGILSKKHHSYLILNRFNVTHKPIQHRRNHRLCYQLYTFAWCPFHLVNHRNPLATLTHQRLAHLPTHT